MRQCRRIIGLFAITIASLAACTSGDKGAADTATADTTSAATIDASAQQSLYDRLGGKDAITAVVDSFVAIVAKDARINKKFARSDVGRVKTMLVDQVCAQAGGPCTYTGLSMKESHRNMGVTDGEFGALVENLVASLTAFKVPAKEQDDLLAALGAMKTDIVEVQSQATGTALPGSFKPAAKR